MDVEEIKQILGLEPLVWEGGFYRETYRSTVTVPRPQVGSEARSLSTAIYYLLTPNSCSVMHRITSDEIFHFYAGDAVEFLTLGEKEDTGLSTLGTNLRQKEMPQKIVRAGVWQGSRLMPGGRYCLMGTTVSPGFDWHDFELGDRETLMAQYPTWSDHIGALTRAPA